MLHRQWTKAGKNEARIEERRDFAVRTPQMQARRRQRVRVDRAGGTRARYLEQGEKKLPSQQKLPIPPPTPPERAPSIPCSRSFFFPDGAVPGPAPTKTTPSTPAPEDDFSFSYSYEPWNNDSNDDGDDGKRFASFLPANFLRVPAHGILRLARFFASFHAREWTPPGNQEDPAVRSSTRPRHISSLYVQPQITSCLFAA